MGKRKRYKDEAIIHGYRGVDGCEIVIDGRPLPQRIHHSPTGYEWSYAGSGPADTALSVLDEVLAEPIKSVDLFEGTCGELAWQLHQPFKFAHVANFDREWQMTVGQVRAWIDDYLAQTGGWVSTDEAARIIEERCGRRPAPATITAWCREGRLVAKRLIRDWSIAADSARTFVWPKRGRPEGS